MTISMTDGWVCPKCGRVFAPQIEECKYCSTEKRHHYRLINPFPIGVSSAGQVMMYPEYLMSQIGGEG